MLSSSHSGEDDIRHAPGQPATRRGDGLNPCLAAEGGGLGGKDALWMTVGFVLCLLVAYAFGRNRILWEDEMLGWMLIHDPSWPHMIAAWRLGADGGGFSFYLLGRAWFALFGPSDLSFRLFSASCFGAAFCVTWSAARRYYALLPVGLALFNTWFFSPAMVTHMAEGRFYGLLVLSTSLVVWLLLTKLQPGHRGAVRTGPGLWVLAFLFNGLLTTSHILGILYSAALLLALVALDLQAGSVRIGLYLSWVLAWLSLLPERVAILASANVGKPWFWTRPPDLRRFLGAFTGFSNEAAVVLLALAVALVLSWGSRPKEVAVAIAAGLEQRRPVYFVMVALAAVPIGMAVEARFGTSLFIDRYLLPVALAVALLIMEALSLVCWRRFSLASRWFSGRRLVPALGCYAVLLLVWVFVPLRHDTIQSRNYTERLTARLPKGLPVVCEDAWAFTEILGRQHDSGVRYTYLLDWEQSLRASAPRLEVTQYHLMENWKKVGYFPGSIQPREAFLRQYPRFLVLTRQVTPTDQYGRMIGNPLAERFAHTPGYEVQPYAPADTLDKDDPDIWLVCRDSCSR